MTINALLMDPRDNVVTCVREVPKGETVAYRAGDDIKTIEAKETIPYCHKIALVDIDEGGQVYIVCPAVDEQEIEADEIELYDIALDRDYMLADEKPPLKARCSLPRSFRSVCKAII